jgi:hypothetical protein
MHNIQSTEMPSVCCILHHVMLRFERGQRRGFSEAREEICKANLCLLLFVAISWVTWFGRVM